MAKKIIWKSDKDADKDFRDRIIAISETAEVTTNHETTLANKGRDLQMANEHRDNAQKVVDDLKAEVAEIKAALGLL